MKAIPNYENYLINEDGTKIYNTRLHRYLKISKIVKHCKTRDYVSPYVCLSKQGVRKVSLINRLVYVTFIGEIPEEFDVDHIDNDPENNHYSNLQLLTHKENKKKCFTDDPTLRERLSEAKKKLYHEDPTLRKRLSEAKKISNKGRVWINNGIINKFVKITEIPEGFVRGIHSSDITKQKIRATRKGRVWVNNGIINKIVKITEIPEGFVKGRIY